MKATALHRANLMENRRTIYGSQFESSTETGMKVMVSKVRSVVLGLIVWCGLGSIPVLAQKWDIGADFMIGLPQNEFRDKIRGEGYGFSGQLRPVYWRLADYDRRQYRIFELRNRGAMGADIHDSGCCHVGPHQEQYFHAPRVCQSPAAGRSNCDLSSKVCMDSNIFSREPR